MYLYVQYSKGHRRRWKRPELNRRGRSRCWGDPSQPSPPGSAAPSFWKKSFRLKHEKDCLNCDPSQPSPQESAVPSFWRRPHISANMGWKLNEKRNQSSVCCNHPGPRDNCCPPTCPPSDGLWKLNIHFMNDFLLVLATFKNLPVERVPSQKENCWDFMCVWLMSWWSVNSLLFDPSQGVGHSQALRGLQSLWLGNNCCLDSAISNMYSTFNSWCLVRKKERFVRKKKLSKCQNVQLILCDTKLHVCQRTSLPKIFFLALLGAGLAGQVQPCEDNSVWRPSPN